MSVEFKLFSCLRVGRNYKRITFRLGVRASDIQLRTIERKFIKSEEVLGEFVEMKMYGRPYDPDVCLLFRHPDSGKVYEFEPSFGSSEGFIEYDPEEESMQRIQERTKIMEIEIQGNDWALRPENVVATQGLDVSHFAP